MNIEKFNSLGLEKRIDEILEWGYSINKFRLNGTVFVRYSIHNFFAVMTLRSSDNTIVDIVAFNAGEIQKEPMNATEGTNKTIFMPMLECCS